MASRGIGGGDFSGLRHRLLVGGLVTLALALSSSTYLFDEFVPVVEAVRDAARRGGRRRRGHGKHHKKHHKHSHGNKGVVEDLPNSSVMVEAEYYRGPEYTQFVAGQISFFKWCRQGILFLTHMVFDEIDLRPREDCVVLMPQVMMYQAPTWLTLPLQESLRLTLERSIQSQLFMIHQVDMLLSRMLGMLANEIRGSDAEYFWSRDKFMAWISKDVRGEVYFLLCAKQQLDPTVASHMNMSLPEYLERLQVKVPMATAKFSEILQTRASQMQPQDVAELHQLAGESEVRLVTAIHEVKELLVNVFCPAYLTARVPVDPAFKQKVEEANQPLAGPGLPERIQENYNPTPGPFEPPFEQQQEQPNLNAVQNAELMQMYQQQQVPTSSVEATPEERQMAEAVLQKEIQQAQIILDQASWRIDDLPKHAEYSWGPQPEASIRLALSSTGVRQFEFLGIDAFGLENVDIERFGGMENVLGEWATRQAIVWNNLASATHRSQLWSSGGLRLRVKLKAQLLCGWDESLGRPRVVERILGNAAPLTPDAWVVVGIPLDSNTVSGDATEVQQIVEAYANRISANGGDTTKDIRRKGMCYSFGIWSRPEVENVQSTCLQFPILVDANNPRHTIHSQCLSLFPTGTRFIVDAAVKVDVPEDIMARISQIRSRVEGLRVHPAMQPPLPPPPAPLVVPKPKKKKKRHPPRGPPRSGRPPPRIAPGGIGGGPSQRPPPPQGPPQRPPSPPKSPEYALLFPNQKSFPPVSASPGGGFGGDAGAATGSTMPGVIAGSAGNSLNVIALLQLQSELQLSPSATPHRTSSALTPLSFIEGLSEIGGALASTPATPFSAGGAGYGVIKSQLPEGRVARVEQGVAMHGPRGGPPAHGGMMPHPQLPPGGYHPGRGPPPPGFAGRAPPGGGGLRPPHFNSRGPPPRGRPGRHPRPAGGRKGSQKGSVSSSSVSSSSASGGSAVSSTPPPPPPPPPEPDVMAPSRQSLEAILQSLASIGPLSVPAVLWTYCSMKGMEGTGLVAQTGSFSTFGEANVRDRETCKANPFMAPYPPQDITPVPFGSDVNRYFNQAVDALNQNDRLVAEIEQTVQRHSEHLAQKAAAEAQAAVVAQQQGGGGGSVYSQQSVGSSAPPPEGFAKPPNQQRSLSSVLRALEAGAAAAQQIPAAGVQQMPAAGVQQMPAAGVQQIPAAGVQQMPAAGVQQIPAAGVQQMPAGASAQPRPPQSSGDPGLPSSEPESLMSGN